MRKNSSIVAIFSERHPVEVVIYGVRGLDVHIVVNAIFTANEGQKNDAPGHQPSTCSHLLRLAPRVPLTKTL